MTTTTAQVQRQPGPSGPLDVEAPGWRDVAKRTMQRVKRDRISIIAGSMAYHSLLALFPVVIAAIGVAALVHLGGSQLTTLVKGIGKALPQGASNVLDTAVTSARHRTSGALTVTIIAIVVSLVSASGAMASMQTGLDIAYEVPTDRRFLSKRLRGLLLLFIVVALGGAASVLVVFAKPLGHAIESHVPLSGLTFTVIWTVARWAVALLLVVTLFALLFRYGPNRKPPKWKWISVGGIVATVIWLLSSLGLSFYDSATGSYGKTYGALAGVVVLLFWFYLTALSIFLGAQLNAELEREALMEGGHTGATPPTGRAPDGNGSRSEASPSPQGGRRSAPTKV